MFRSVKVPYISFMSNTLQQRPALMNRRRRHPSGTRGLHPLRGKRRRTIPGLLASQAPKTPVRGVAQRLTAGVGARRDMLLLIRRQQPAFHGWRTTHTPTHPAYNGACVPSKAVTASGAQPHLLHPKVAAALLVDRPTANGARHFLLLPKAMVTMALGRRGCVASSLTTMVIWIRNSWLEPHRREGKIIYLISFQKV
jgi:hypothetical protein